MTRRHIAVSLVAIAAVIAAILVFCRTSTPTTSTAERGPARRGSAGHDVTGAGDDRLRWLGQRGASDRRIAGVVLYDGAPVAGATVRLASQLSMAGVARDVERVTDAQGRFDFGAQLATAYVITADKPKLTGALQRLDLRFPTFPVDDLHLVLHACDASLHGVVRDTAGGVIARARVAVTDREIETHAGVDTDDKGAYELCVPVGDGRVSVTADGYARQLEDVNAYGPLRRDFALSPEASVAGRVLRADDRTPVANAIVELVPDEEAVGVRGGKLYATSDEDGRFRFEGATPGQHELRAKADGLASKPVYVIAEVAAGEEVICLVERTHSVSGRVVDRGTKLGVAAITVGLLPATAPGPSFSYVASQPDGSFVIDHLFPDEYRPALQLYDIVNKPPNIVVANTDVTGVVLEMDSAGSIAGRVTHDGKGVDRTPVTARSQRTRGAFTDHAGNFVIRDLPPGRYQLYAESKRAGAFATGPTIELARGEHRTGADIDMNLSSSISGIVVDQNDAPVGGATLNFSLLQGRDFGVATTADDGTFKATALSGGGEYAYEVSADIRSSIIFPPVDRKRHAPIAVADGNTRITGVRIKVRVDPQQSVAGHVLSSAGKPIADALVGIEPETSPRQRVRTDETGAFRITGIAPGTTTVLVTAVAGARTGNLVRVAVGRTDLELRLSDPGAIEGTLEGFTGTPEVTAREIDSNAHRYRVTAGGNTFRISNVPSGLYSVTARSANGIAGAGEVEVKAGETVKLALRQRGTGRLEGTVTSQGPVANLRCAAMDVVAQTRLVTTTDTAGAFRFEKLTEGKAYVQCGSASKQVAIVANETARVSLELDEEQMTKRDLGFEVVQQLSDVRVSVVTPRGVAERSGMKVGDIITKVDDRAVSSTYDADLRWSTAGTTVKLTVDRGETQLVLELVVPDN